MADLVNKDILKALVPPSALNSENFHELSGKTYVEEVAAGKAVFKQGDVDKKAVYLLEGELAITSEKGVASVVKSGTPAAKHPLANTQPRISTAIAKVPSKITRIDSDLLDVLMTWDQMSGIEVGEIQVEEDSGDDDGGDWMTRILQSKAFMQVPPGNIQQIFMRIEEVPVKVGDVIIKQGDDGEDYFIIKEGKCKVTRTSKTGSELTLAKLGNGDAFGEEALLSETKRNANIVMTTDGAVMKLSKSDFNSLLKEPMVKSVTNAEAEEMVKNGAIWLDVRLDSEHKNNAIEGSMNLPLFMLRMKADTLDPIKQYILYDDTGRRSEAAAFLLSERGINASVLKGGLVGREGS